MKKLNCGVIGMGRLGFRHACNLASGIANANLIAAADVYQPSLDKLVERFPTVTTYTDYKELLKNDDVEAVIIATSTEKHAEVLEEAIKAKKKVFCEKPLATNIEDAIALADLAKKYDSFVQLGFMRRFDTAYVNAKKRIESGDLGKPISILAIGRDPGCPPIEFAKKSGGLVSDMAVHDIDLTRWFFNSEAKEVFATGGVLRFPELGEIGDIDHCAITMTFENGGIAQLEVSRNAIYGYDIRTEVVCENGAAFVGKIKDDSTMIYKDAKMECKTVPGFLDRFETAYLNEMQVFVDDALEGKKQSCVGMEDGLNAIKIVDAINESIKTGKTVTV